MCVCVCVCARVYECMHVSVCVCVCVCTCRLSLTQAMSLVTDRAGETTLLSNVTRNKSGHQAGGWKKTNVQSHGPILPFNGPTTIQ